MGWERSDAVAHTPGVVLLDEFATCNPEHSTKRSSVPHSHGKLCKHYPYFGVGSLEEKSLMFKGIQASGRNKAFLFRKSNSSFLKIRKHR